MEQMQTVPASAKIPLYCAFVMLSVIVIVLQVFNEMFKELMPEPEVLAMLSHSQEFEQVKVRWSWGQKSLNYPLDMDLYGEQRFAPFQQLVPGPSERLLTFCRETNHKRSQQSTLIPLAQRAGKSKVVFLFLFGLKLGRFVFFSLF